MSSAAESFLYIWYDTKNKMFYLGKHKGTPIDSYTHSSSMMESFNKDNIPSHMKRRILAYGTDEEMCLLEHECLKNRKEKKWERYYNQGLGDPRYSVMPLGKDHPAYKHGMSYDKEWNRERWKSYYQKNKDKKLEYQRQYKEENRDKDREHQKRWRGKNPNYYKEWREQNIEYDRERGKTYYQKNRDKKLEYQKKYRARKKAENYIVEHCQ